MLKNVSDRIAFAVVFDSQQRNWWRRDGRVEDHAFRRRHAAMTERVVPIFALSEDQRVALVGAAAATEDAKMIRPCC